MSSTARTGLIAALITLFIAAGIGGMFWFASRRPSIRHQSTSQIPASNPDDPVAYLTRHRWWKVPPSAERVSQLADAIVAANAGDFVWFSETGETLTAAYHPGLIEGLIGPKGYTGRQFVCQIPRNISRRFTHDEALKALVAAINRAEIKNGPYKP